MIVLFVHWKREKKDVRNYIRRIKKMIIDNVYVYTANKIFVKGGIVLDGDKIMRVYEEEDAPKLTVKEIMQSRD